MRRYLKILSHTTMHSSLSILPSTSLSLSLLTSMHQTLPPLTIDRPDVLTVQTGRVAVQVEGTAQLSCTYDSVPAPNTVFWRHNLKVIDPQTDSNITVVYNDHMTTLTRANMPADGRGVYECVAGNVLGESENETIVFVPSKWW